jgi:hypothetical protein
MFLLGGTLFPAFAESVYTALPEAKVDQARKAFIEKTALGLLTAWAEGKFAALPDSFTTKMIKELTPEVQKAAYAKIQKAFGDFKSMTFAEAGTSPKVPGAVIYRFKATFSMAKDKPEIRVVANDKGKIEGLFVLKWNEGI